MPTPPILNPCSTSLLPIQGSGYNTVDVPGPDSRGYGNNTDKLLYEIWQVLELILAAQNPPGIVQPIIFTVGDGQSGTPATGDTSYRNATVPNKELLVIRNGIQLQYSNGITALQIIRFNDGTDGGFDFDPASGLSFQNGDSFQIFPIGANTTIEP